MSDVTTPVETAPAAQPSSENVLELRESVNEAKATLAAESAAIDEQKRKGGRPPGSRDKRPRAPYGSKKHLSVVPGAQPSVAETEPEAPQASMLPAIEAALKVPFDMAAAKTGCAALCVTSDEAKPAVEAIDQAIRIYFPDALEKNPKEMALISLAIALGGLALAKFSAYSQWQLEQAALKAANAPAEAKAPEQAAPAGGRPAAEYFTNTRAFPN